MNDTLIQLIEDRMQKNRYSIREVSRQVGVAHTTIIRVLGKETVDVDTLIKLCKWLGVSPAIALDGMIETDRTLADQIATVLEAYPGLKEVFTEAMERLNRGEISPDTMADLIAYANYRLNVKA